LARCFSGCNGIQSASAVHRTRIRFFNACGADTGANFTFGRLSPQACAEGRAEDGRQRPLNSTASGVLGLAAPLKLASGLHYRTVWDLRPPAATWGAATEVRGQEHAVGATGSFGGLPAVDWLFTFPRCRVVSARTGRSLRAFAGRTRFWATATPPAPPLSRSFGAQHIKTVFRSAIRRPDQWCCRLPPHEESYCLQTGLLELCEKMASDAQYEIESRSCDRTPLVGDAQSEFYPPTNRPRLQSSRLARLLSNWVQDSGAARVMRWQDRGHLFDGRFDEVRKRVGTRRCDGTSCAI